ncbi:sensor histidine kinase [Caballeronia grimmiae]|uniref:sensor histidine kinase n=1 Tax=Caballeronia grimmiae TaxID=1071679 RepID=UPI00055B2D1A|nr:HAMP domain-containing sensor histidine kinase [Caballeronia grimmiae]
MRDEVDAIVDEFAEFARSHLRSASRLSEHELRDTAAELLNHIAEDMDARQSELERSSKSRGDSPLNAPSLVGDAQSHAQGRLAESFSLNEMVSEYRALRASVMRRWREAGVADPVTALEEAVRFNEAIDQALTESIAWFTAERDRSRELLSGVIAHDLRTPLGAIAMSAQFLVRSEALRDAETRAAGRIVSSAGIMAKMVSDLLDFAQVRMGGHLSISPARMSLSELCTDAVTELRAFHPERSIELDIKDTIDGHWDRDRVRQMISNLVENAVGHGAAEAPVKVSAVRSGAHVQLAVHNFGEPIPPVHQSSIFSPLTRLSKDGERSRRPNGIGLGLFIVMEIAEAHGGSVSVISDREAGTTFTVSLPVA